MQSRGRVLFVYTDFNVGGIQTQILEMCKYNNNKGLRSKVLILTDIYDIKLLEELKVHADVSFLNQYMLDCTWNKALVRVSSLYSPLCKFDKIKLSLFLSGVDSCHVTNLFSFYFVSTLIFLNVFKQIRLTLGFYHANEISILPDDVSFYKRIVKSVKTLEPSSIISTSEKTTKNISEIFGQIKKELNVVEIALGVPRHGEFQRKSKNKHLSILSIGRLVPFKTYNFHILEEVKNLKKEGYSIYYTIIGDGPEYDNLTQYIIEQGLGKNVTLIRNVDYAELEYFIDKADVFVGSGTSLILAAGRSCISIIGIESNADSNTYGYLSNTRGQNYNELGLDYPKHSFRTYIMDLLDMDNSKFNTLRRNDYDRSNDFSIDEFMKTFNSANLNAKLYGGFSYQSFLCIQLKLIQSLVVDRVFKNKIISKKY